MNRSKVNIYNEFERNLSNFKGQTFSDQKRFDQAEQPKYPNFEPTQKSALLGSSGWGINKLQLKYKNAYDSSSINREHLKFLDQRLPSNYGGGIAGF